jgi:hypothetical protein
LLISAPFAAEKDLSPSVNIDESCSSFSIVPASCCCSPDEGLELCALSFQTVASNSCQEWVELCCRSHEHQMKLLTKEEEQAHYKYVAAVSYSILSIAMDTMHVNYIVPATRNFGVVLSSTIVPPSKAAF